MKGSVSKYTVSGSSKPKWRYRIYLGTDENGKQLYDGRGGYAKQSEAETAKNARIAEILNPATSAPTKTEPSLGEWLRTWLETHGPRKCQPKTLERYEQLAGYILKSPEGCATELASAPISAATHGVIEPVLYAPMKAKGKRLEHISVKTIRHIAGFSAWR